jgi:hypothetical protein
MFRVFQNLPDCGSCRPNNPVGTAAMTEWNDLLHLKVDQFVK